jgi:predicted dehydrogenase
MEAEFHFDRYPLLSPKQHKETANAGAGILKDLGPHLIDQAVYLFGFPQSVYADIRTTREHSLVDDWIDILLYYPNTSASWFFCSGSDPAYAIHGKRSFLKPRVMYRRRFEIGQTKFNSWERLLKRRALACRN